MVNASIFCQSNSSHCNFHKRTDRWAIPRSRRAAPSSIPAVRKTISAGISKATTSKTAGTPTSRSKSCRVRNMLATVGGLICHPLNRLNYQSQETFVAVHVRLQATSADRIPIIPSRSCKSHGFSCAPIMRPYARHDRTLGRSGYLPDRADPLLFGLAPSTAALPSLTVFSLNKIKRYHHHPPGSGTG